VTRQPQKATSVISASTNRWRPFWPIVLLIAAWGATAFGYADRRWLSNDIITDSPITPNNARMDITKLDASFPSPNALWFNIHFINNGAATALHMANIGHSTVTTTLIDPDIIDGEFFIMKKKLDRVKNVDTTNEVVSHGTIMTSFPQPFGVVLNDEQVTLVRSGKLLVYLFGMVRYNDNNLPNGKHIYAEICIYSLGLDAIHYCESGHNRSYISD
jgi:hypothetical protein